jgi:hypothetical protein
MNAVEFAAIVGLLLMNAFGNQQAMQPIRQLAQLAFNVADDSFQVGAQFASLRIEMFALTGSGIAALLHQRPFA